MECPIRTRELKRLRHELHALVQCLDSRLAGKPDINAHAREHQAAARAKAALERCYG